MNILVIKLSGLGGFICALGDMEAIRKRHPQAHITLLTTQPFADMAQRSGYFDEIAIDVGAWFSLFRFFNRGNFSHVYDLQNNRRTAFYYRLFMKKPELKLADVDAPPPDLSWMTTSAFDIQKPYALLIPGGDPQQRWPAARYGALALKLLQDGIQSVLIGTSAEAEVIKAIHRACPRAMDLSGRTSLYDIASLAQGAALAVGNDTGPTHLAALACCPTVVVEPSDSVGSVYNRL